MNLKNMEFYSEPSSPKHCMSPFGLGRSHPNSTIDEFEFETSCRFNLNDIDFDLVNRTEQQNKQRMQSENHFLPAMAFADELFSDGKVLPLPPRLKLPARLEGRNDNRSSKSSTASSPRSPVSALKIKFVRQNLWNDDFDPFMVALRSVKEDGTGKAQANNHRPAQAHSPFPQRPNNSIDQTMGPQLPYHTNSQQPNSRYGPVESPKMLTEPKELAFARAIAKMDHVTRRRFNWFTVSGPILKSNENRRISKRFYTWKRNKFKKILSLFGKLGLKSARSTQ